MNFTKHNEHPELLRQLALEVIDNIPSQALVLYSDGGRTGSGVFMRTNTEKFRYRFRNPDNSSVFRSELVDIREALNLALGNRASDTWILIDSKSSVQFLYLKDILESALPGLLCHVPWIMDIVV
ncbi:RNase H domain-containing protein [Trichonephila clavata]|uniref:RNase H domain-containing protein n=1 Tax=Trichonephila clavata TaxID=2740835 RepID=A0A8X6HWA4_TRICU|nr:RNase H domain-containing protein [Trichonephila clavata]